MKKTYRQALQALGVLAALVLIVILFMLPSISENFKERLIQGDLKPLDKPEAKGPLLLGMSAPFSGDFAELGNGIKTGIETYLKAINSKGGLQGRMLELTALDDGSIARRAFNNTRELIESRHVFAIIGNTGAFNVDVTAPFTAQNKTLFFGGRNTALAVSDPALKYYAFNYRPTFAEESGFATRYLLQNQNIPADKIAVIARNDSAGDRIFNGVKEVLKARGVQNVLRIPLDQEDGAEVAVKQVFENAANISGIVLFSPYKASIKVIELIRNRNPRMAFAAASSQGGTESFVEGLKRLGPLGENIMYTQLVPSLQSNAPLVVAYLQDLKNYFPDQQPNASSLEGYLTAKIVIEAFTRALPDITTDKVIQALLTMKDFDIGIGHPISFSPENHQASHKIWGMVLKGDGQEQTIDVN